MSWLYTMSVFYLLNVGGGTHSGIHLLFLLSSYVVFLHSFMRRWPEWWTQTRKGRSSAMLLAVLRWVCWGKTKWCCACVCTSACNMKRFTLKRLKEWVTTSHIREKQNSMELSETQTVNKAVGVKVPIEKRALWSQHHCWLSYRMNSWNGE